MNTFQDTPEKIFLVGFSGSGKSTVGPLLAQRLEYDFIDTDAILAEKFGKEISAIFAEDGEAAFREMETEVIRQIVGLGGARQVVSLGGGAFIREENRELVQAAGAAVYLRCSVQELHRRMKRHNDRPLLVVRPKPGETEQGAARRRIGEMLGERRPFYQMADFTVSTSSRFPNEAVEQILQRLRSRHGKN